MRRETLSVVVFNVPATTAANTTYTKFVDVRGVIDGSVQVNWTAGAGGGTLSYKAYATSIEARDEADAAYKDASIADCFPDISSLLLGAAALNGDSYITDSAKLLGKPTWLKVEAVIANRDDATALYSTINLCY